MEKPRSISHKSRAIKLPTKDGGVIEMSVIINNGNYVFYLLQEELSLIGAKNLYGAFKHISINGLKRNRDIEDKWGDWHTIPGALIIAEPLEPLN